MCSIWKWQSSSRKSIEHVPKESEWAHSAANESFWIPFFFIGTRFFVEQGLKWYSQTCRTPTPSHLLYSWKTTNFECHGLSMNKSFLHLTSVFYRPPAAFFVYSGFGYRKTNTPFGSKCFLFLHLFLFSHDGIKRTHSHSSNDMYRAAVITAHSMTIV